jgi:hypothetical protein
MQICSASRAPTTQLDKCKAVLGLPGSHLNSELRNVETRSLPTLTHVLPSIWNSLFPQLARCYPSQFCLDHSHCPVLAPATLAALPSTRAIETRSLPSSLAATHRGFAFYVAFPKRSIPSFATCSMSSVPLTPFFETTAYPPDRQDEATKLVLQQAELLCAEWAA